MATLSFAFNIRNIRTICKKISKKEQKKKRENFKKQREREIKERNTT